MARIRSIKPEFPQSESTGRLSRDSRLLFIQLWTIVDDVGRARAASRMLASLLYPYDDDAPKLIDRWLDELEREHMIRRYEVDGSIYLEVVNWLKHQKIDHPSASRLPPFRETSRGLASDSGKLAPDLGPRTLDLGNGSDDGDEERAGARGKSLITSEALLLAKELAEVCGHDHEFVPPAWAGAAMHIQKWLSGGWPAAVILETAKSVSAKKRDGPPSSVLYFENAIAIAVARLNAPLPHVTITEREIHAGSNGRKPNGIQEALRTMAAASGLDESCENVVGMLPIGGRK